LCLQQLPDTLASKRCDAHPQRIMLAYIRPHRITASKQRGGAHGVRPAGAGRRHVTPSLDWRDNAKLFGQHPFIHAEMQVHLFLRDRLNQNVDLVR
jgi:hypothetical protein